MTSTKPQFAIAELLKAAELAQIDPATLPANANPWTLKGDSRAFAWQTAFRSINPTAAEQAEIAYGPSLSLALQAALDGIRPMNADLEKELSIKRPNQHSEMQKAAANEAIARIQKGLEDERARRAELTPSPEQLQRQLAESREAAARTLRLQNGVIPHEA
jgi:hypothetical protein